MTELQINFAFPGDLAAEISSNIFRRMETSFCNSSICSWLEACSVKKKWLKIESSTVAHHNL